MYDLLYVFQNHKVDGLSGWTYEKEMQIDYMIQIDVGHFWKKDW